MSQHGMIEVVTTTDEHIQCNISRFFSASARSSTRDIISLETGEVLYSSTRGVARYSDEGFDIIFGVSSLL